MDDVTVLFRKIVYLDSESKNPDVALKKQPAVEQGCPQPLAYVRTFLFIREVKMRINITALLHHHSLK